MESWTTFLLRFHILLDIIWNWIVYQTWWRIWITDAENKAIELPNYNIVVNHNYHAIIIHTPVFRFKFQHNESHIHPWRTQLFLHLYKSSFLLQRTPQASSPRRNTAVFCCSILFFLNITSQTGLLIHNSFHAAIDKRKVSRFVRFLCSLMEKKTQKEKLEL